MAVPYLRIRWLAVLIIAVILNACSDSQPAPNPATVPTATHTPEQTAAPAVSPDFRGEYP